MKVFLGSYQITDHVVDQYQARIKKRRYKDVRTCIKNDLRTLNIRKIVSYANEVHIFTKGYKEFIFTVEKRRSGNYYILNTVIRRDMDSIQRAIRKRERAKEEHEKAKQK